MDHMKVLKRAWHIVWNYRGLWVLGFILALVAAGGGGNGTQFSSSRAASSPGGEAIPPEVVGMLVAIGVVLVCVVFILAIVATVARYVMETALIRLVDDYEETGEKRGVRQGLRMGWSRTALRLFLIDLLIDVPVAVVFFLLFLLAAAPLLLWIIEDEAPRVMGTATTGCLFFLIMLLTIVVSVIVSVLKCFFWRVCALEELGVIESIRQGYAVVRQHLQDVAVMQLITTGLELGWSLVLIPIALLLVILGGVIAAVPALLVGGLASLVFEETVPWILAAMIGLPVFMLVLAVPMTFLGGLMKVFQSSTWTLTYRELRALEDQEPARLPEAAAPDLEVAPDA